MSYTKAYLEKIDYFKDTDLEHCLDSLTGVINRENIIAYIKYLIYHNTPFSLCIFDIDNFKLVNDELGHQMGDEVLKKTSMKLVSGMKNSLVGRYGGDEFLVVTPYYVLYDEVWNLCKKIFDDFRIVKLPSFQNSYVTITAGAVSYPKDALQYDELFKKADKALYRGKQKGRNCFIIYDDAKHKNIDVSDRSIQISEMMDYMYTISTSKRPTMERIKSLCFYIDNYFKIAGYFIPRDLKCLRMDFDESKILPDLSRNFIQEVLGDTTNLYINDYYILQDLSMDFHDYCLEHKIKSLVVTKISAFGKDFGYILFANYNFKRVWQTEDKVLFSFLAKLISLLIYYEKEPSLS